MIILETIFSIIIVYFITKFINKPLIKDTQVSLKEKNIIFATSSLLVIGINLALRYLFGYLGFLIETFQIFGSGVPNSYEQLEFLSFALIITLFIPIYKLFFEKICKNRGIEKRNTMFIKRSVLIIGISWIIALIFLSIDILDIEIGHLIPPDFLSPDYDTFFRYGPGAKTGYCFSRFQGAAPDYFMGMDVYSSWDFLAFYPGSLHVSTGQSHQPPLQIYDQAGLDKHVCSLNPAVRRVDSPPLSLDRCQLFYPTPAGPR